MGDWSKFTIIDTYQYDKYANTNEAVGRFYVLASDIPSSLPSVGDAGPSGMTSWYVDRVQAIPESKESYVVTVYFKDTLYKGVQVLAASSADLNADATMTHDMGSFFCSPEILGLRRLFETERAVFEDVYYPGLIDWMPSGVIKTNYYPYFRPMTVGEWLNNNYVPTACPFTKRPHWKHLNKEMSTAIIICKFNVAKNNVPSTSFRGVNTSSNIPSDFDCDDRTTAGKWRAMRQTTSNIKSREGTSYRVVRRWLAHPPRGGDFAGSALTWDDDKVGGYFTW